MKCGYTVVCKIQTDYFRGLDGVEMWLHLERDQALLITLKWILATVYFATAICRYYNYFIHVF